MLHVLSHTYVFIRASTSTICCLQAVVKGREVQLSAHASCVCVCLCVCVCVCMHRYLTDRRARVISAYQQLQSEGGQGFKPSVASVAQHTGLPEEWVADIISTLSTRVVSAEQTTDVSTSDTHTHTHTHTLMDT